MAPAFEYFATMASSWRKEVPQKQDEETVFGDSIAYLSNLMTVGTLTAGFVATGAFLSVQFTGNEDFRAGGHLQKFIDASLKAGIAAMVAVMITFVFSTVATQHRLHHGLKGAMWVLRTAMLFAGIAELLIYASFFEYMKSMHEYSHMYYIGPDICPFHKANETSGPAFQRNSSVCANTGMDLFKAAWAKCEGPQTIQWEGERCKGNRASGDMLCSVFDCYSNSKAFNDSEVDSAAENAIDFGYRGFPINLMTKDYGYEQFYKKSWRKKNATVKETVWQAISLRKEQEHATAQAAFLQVLDVSSKQHCGQDDAEEEVKASCRNTSTTSDRLACSAARIAWAQTQQCTEATFDGALQCHKVCEWVVDETCLRENNVTALSAKSIEEKCVQTARENSQHASFNAVFWRVLKGLLVVTVLRSIAIALRTVSLLLQVGMHLYTKGKTSRRKSCRDALLCLDVFGILPALMDCLNDCMVCTGHAEPEELAESQSDESPSETKRMMTHN